MTINNKPSNNPANAGALLLAGELRVLLGRLKRRLREETHPTGLTAAQISALSHLYRKGPATVTDLAKAEGVRPQSMGATVSALLAAGWVSGAADPADGRRTILSLTAACRDMIAANLAAREDWLYYAIASQFTPAEQQDIANAVELLKRLVSP